MFDGSEFISDHVGAWIFLCAQVCLSSNYKGPIVLIQHFTGITDPYKFNIQEN